MEERNCKKCIWLDGCLSDGCATDPCEDYYENDTKDLERHLSKEKKRYYKEWMEYLRDTE